MWVKCCGLNFWSASFLWSTTKMNGNWLFFGQILVLHYFKINYNSMDKRIHTLWSQKREKQAAALKKMQVSNYFFTFVFCSWAKLLAISQEVLVFTLFTSSLQRASLQGRCLSSPSLPQVGCGGDPTVGWGTLSGLVTKKDCHGLTWQAFEHHTAARTHPHPLPPAQWDGGKNRRKSKICGLR